jgi:hypothetical protein
MADIKRKGYTQAGTPTSALTTELNSLATATATAAGPAQDNSSNLDLYADFVLSVTFGTNPTAGATVDLYLLPSVDGGTNYADAVVAATPARNMLVGSFYCRAVTTAQIMTVTNVPIPEKFKMMVVNNSGQSFPASGSTVKYQSWHLQAV